MSTFSQPDLLRMRGGAGNVIELQRRAVFVVQPLHQQQRGGDAAAFWANVECGKALRQPHIVPLPESAVGVCMVFGQSLSQIT